MASNYYCPQCSSFNIKRIHRSFIQPKLAINADHARQNLVKAPC